jgi:signal transduction histidine kinase
MLHEFLTDNREAILVLTKKKTEEISESRPSSKELEAGLPEFYSHLIRVLKEQSLGMPKGNIRSYAPSTNHHGKESLRLGYTLSQVVRGYGVICQAITETAQTMRAEITAGEFSTLNLSLDLAIAEAVTAYESQDSDPSTLDSSKKMGFLIHELRNALTSAMVAHSMVKRGVVGTGGSTNTLMERNLRRMRDLLDHSFSEIRLENQQGADRHPMLLIDAVEDVEITASEEARLKGQTLLVQVDQKIKINVDRNYLVSALSNLVQNAIKFSKRGGTICMRSLEGEKTIVLEVEDQCGGLPAGEAEKLFKPFTQKGENRSGLGLGLSISRRAIALNHGYLSARDIPGVGCVFFITIPKIGQTALTH